MQEVGIELRYAYAGAGIVHAAHVLHGTEQSYLALVVAVCFEALEHGLTVMEDRSGGIENEGRVRLDAGVVIIPLSVMILHHEHVIGEVLAEFQIGVLVFELCAFNKFHICCLCG